MKKRKPVVVFICTHNACRSQIAEAFGRVMAGDVFTSYSAGTHSKDAINPDVVRLMAEKYGIDVIKNGQIIYCPFLCSFSNNIFHFFVFRKNI